MTALYTCMEDRGYDVSDLIQSTEGFASDDEIDPTLNLAGHKVFVYHGTLDSVVDPGRRESEL